jgi:hypothetical protein
MKSGMAVGRMLPLGLILVSLAVASLAAVVYTGDSPRQTESQSTSVSTPSTVNVFGLVSAIGPGTHLVSLSFTDTVTGANLTAPVTNEHFSINLPNGAIYAVSARWAGNRSWQGGFIDRGTLTVNMSAGSSGAMSYNLQVETPPTVLAVQGTIAQSRPAAHPVMVAYTASDGESFQADVQNGTFSARLPNMMDYQVKVFWQNSDGTVDYYFASDQTVNEAVGVAGLVLVIR